ncbi:dipeptidase PepE [Phaeocystidibacter luteus]|uniref:dipeptidase E n=1 Tax=Phaeocystidibacter luteus TaxID=911197 RepID=A0A6N6RJW0_9FLAO|nr:dipeptidase PepE [Phaeocystidibacter luteus]KAB2808088.1 dipeptidase PepE [Phaeocystidibacter luteus]
MRLLIVSTSSIHGKPYLTYLEDEVKSFFQGKKILFVPYARPGGISWDEYTAKASERFTEWGFEMTGIHTHEDPIKALAEADGVFTGGGNTFVLVKTLYDLGLMKPLKEAVENGLPYMGSSAGSNLTGLTVRTTNDMPIVYPPSFDALGLVPFNINPHYLDPDPSSTHMGETRETRINEFHHFNDQPVIGIREGSWLRREGDQLELKGPHTARLFRKGSAAIEREQGDWSDLL